jgi:D-glycero-D-manno-heptose 1,7-bisphosphate phosphatase
MPLSGKETHDRTKAVFLDRDGVLNKAIVVGNRPYPPMSLEHFELLPGVVEACFRLKKAGFKLFVVTNQPDISRGKLSSDLLYEMNEKLRKELPLDDVFICIHDDSDLCSCRKPKPGLLYTAANKYRISLTESYLVGDRWKDITAGQAAGCKCFFIDNNYDERAPSLPYNKVGSLQGASLKILEGHNDAKH